MKKKLAYPILMIIIFGIVAILLIMSQNKKYDGLEVTIYKSASCGCCENYFPYLKQKGFKIKKITVQDISKIKRENGIPENMESCHTIIIGNYFIEGHVPLEAIDKLLEEKPDIDGISLPNMPSGSLGMPGQKRGDFVVFQIKDGEFSEFMRI